ncbi:MAG: DUF973 family protein [Thermoplasmata archaeon]|nr:DUF973 family protein [Thermoplasmata archaeon]
MVAAEETDDDEGHRYFVSKEAPVEPDEESTPLEAPPVEVEISGIRRIQAGAIAGILGIAMGAIAPVYLIFFIGAALTSSTSGSGSVSNAYTVIAGLITIAFVGVALLFVSVLLYVAGFAKLRRADRQFGAPLALSVIGLIGLLILATEVGILAVFALQVLNCGGPGHWTAACVTISPVTVDPTYLLLGLAVGIVGWIGLILGLYRVGRRYSSTITRVGAILYVIPLADIVAPVLILVGSRGILRGLRAAQAAPPPTEAAPS